MKPKIVTKNKYKSRTLVNQQNHSQKSTLVLGQKAKINQCSNMQSSKSISAKNGSLAKQSKFDQLKRQIKNLQNSQFLSMKYRCATQPDNFEDVQFKLTGKQFMPSKKITQLQRFKMHLRKKGKKRKISLLLDKTPFQEANENNNKISVLQVQDINISQSNLRQNNLKKKQTPSIVRKYYRPQTGINHRSMSQLGKKQNEIRGRSLKSSATNRLQKENVLIFCF